MDSRLNGFSDSVNAVDFQEDIVYQSFLDPPNLLNGFQFTENNTLDANFMDFYTSPPSLDPANFLPSPSMSSETDSPDENHSNPVLKYLNQILLEENLEESPSMFHDPLALRATEKSLYDALGEQYPSSPYQLNQNADSPDSLFGISSQHSTTSSTTNGSSLDPHLAMVDPEQYQLSPGNGFALDYSSRSSSQINSQFFNSSKKFGSSPDGQMDAPAYDYLVPNIFSDSESMLQFQKGMEEASKFLPTNNQLIIDLDQYQLPPKSDEASPERSVKLEEKEDSPDGSRGRKHLHWEDSAPEEQRSRKQSAVHVEEEELSELFDRILLCTDTKGALNCCNNDDLVIACVDKAQQINGVTNGSSGGKNRPRKKGNKSETVDLRTLLISCAQSVASGDRRTVNEQLKQIRQHSSSSGDAWQRLAHVFANGLEARLAGTGSQLSTPPKSKRSSAVEKLKAYQVYLSASPIKLMSIFFANKMIADVASKAKTLHIVDFGILYGFQWPILIQYLSTLPGGPPRLRITGIEYPQPGFRPVERVEETGQRLARYCERFHVPFEYQAIAKQNWEEIRIKDLNIREGEVLAVNSLFRFRNLPDESVVAHSPRDTVLKLIRKMKPDIFVNAVINGSYSSPFFVTRFREALFHYSSLFDMFDATVSREDEQRINFEQEFFGREAINVISCEGPERVERPETYKQWQVRHARAGLKPLPLNLECLNKLRGKVKAAYHKDFVLDADGSWMLQGWKGRIMYASSCFVPA